MSLHWSKNQTKHYFNIAQFAKLCKTEEMKPTKPLQEPLRIALLWQVSPFFGQRVLTGIYRQASFSPDVVIRQFAGAYGKTMEKHIRAVLDWKPHGVIVRLTDPEDLRRWRSILPGIPFVATTVVPVDLAEAVISMDVREALSMALEHFQSRGIQHCAYFYGSVPETAHRRKVPFFELAPQGYWHQALLKDVSLFDGLSREDYEAIEQWIHSLPKPAGIICFEAMISPRLIEFVQQLGYSVPRDIQIIGADDVDQCLSVTPHLSAMDVPCEKIGEQACETLITMLTKGDLRPLGHLQVKGASLILRGSTGLSSVGMERVATAVNLIQKNPLKGMSAGHLVKKSKVSHTTFYKQFRETTGTTPAKQLRETRLNQACEMLVKSDFSVSDIAEQCGFSGGNYFARFFRNAMGITPTEYREQQRQLDD